MKITFLGTSHGVPSETRSCSCAMIETGGAVYFIDGGAPITRELMKRGIAPERTKAFFNTHFHGDHILGAIEFFSLCGWFYGKSAYDVYLPEEKACETIAALLDATDGFKKQDRIKLVCYDGSFRYKDENIELTPVPTKHLASQGRPSYGFDIKAEGKRLLFSGDMEHMALSDFPQTLYSEHFDLFVVECAHFPYETLKNKLKGINCSKVAVNHIGFPVEGKIAEINASASEFDFDIFAPDDGCEIVL